MNIVIQTDRDNDALYLALTPRAFRKGAVAATKRVDADVSVDLDRGGAVLGLEIMNARARLGASWHDVGLDELVGVKEAAAIVGVRPPNFVRDHAGAAAFPKPVAELSSGRIWLRSQVEAYARQRTRRRAS